MTKPKSAASFKRHLNQVGLTNSAIEAAWPEWWSTAADASPSALADAKFSVARKLGLDPRSLIGDEEPRFIWQDATKYKNFSGKPSEQAAITAFGTALTRQLLSATPAASQTLEGLTAEYLRAALLADGQRFVTLSGLMALCWGLGIPVIHLRVYPLSAKRMCAMAVRFADRFAILLARDAEYPAPIAFHLAHEIGHIALSHLAGNSALIDMADPGEADARDEEEEAADRYALTLLTGSAAPDIQISGGARNSTSLASQALDLAIPHRIEPGTLALCYGHATRNWDVAVRALSKIYSESRPAWVEVNKTALSQLQLTNLSEDSANYIQAVLGGLT